MARETQTPATRPRLSRNVRVLSAVSFFQDAASEMLYPVLPLFLTGVIGAPVYVVGLIEGIAEGTANVTKIVSGGLADRVRRKPLVSAGYGLSSLSKLVIFFAQSWPLVLVARFFDRTGKGIRTSPRDALIATDTPSEIRGRAFGFHRAADTAGAVVGPLIGLGLYEAMGHRIRPLFLVAAIPAAASVLLTGFVRERSSPSSDREEIGRPVALPARYWRVVALLSVFGFVNFSDALIILRAKELGLGFVGVILAYTLYNVSYAALGFPAGVVSDRLPRRYVYAVGLAAFSVAYVGLGATHASAWVWALLPIYGAYTALTDGVGKAWISDLLPATRLGTGLGMFQGLQGGAAVVAGIWAGVLWGGTGRLPFLVSGTSVAVLTVVLLVAGRRLERESA